MNILASEWLKIRSVRPAYPIAGLGLSAVLLGLVLAKATAGRDDTAPLEQRPHAPIADLEETIAIVPQLCMGVLGVLAITSKYTTGSIRTSVTLIPRRQPVLAAKSAVVGALGLLVGALSVFGTYVAARGVLGDRFSAAYTTAFGNRLPLMTALSRIVPILGLLGLGLGGLLQSAAGATAIVGLVYMTPIIIGNIPEPWNGHLDSLMIGALPQQITGDLITTSVYGSLLPLPAAIAILITYAAVPSLAAIWLIRRREA